MIGLLLLLVQAYKRASFLSRIDYGRARAPTDDDEDGRRTSRRVHAGLQNRRAQSFGRRSGTERNGSERSKLGRADRREIGERLRQKLASVPLHHPPRSIARAKQEDAGCRRMNVGVGYVERKTIRVKLI